MTEPAPSDVVNLPNGWRLVTHGAAQLSIDECGLLRFPRHCTPTEAPDWASAITTAAAIGIQMQADNAEKAEANKTRGLPTRRLIVTEGPPPPGATPLRAAIGHPNTRRQQGTRQ